MTPTDQRLREIAERENKATNGPWVADSGHCLKCDGWHLEGPSEIGGTGILIQLREGTNQIGDLDFIAHSRQDVPWLLELIKKQREALAHIVKFGEFQCEQMCAEDYIPRGRHAPECPIEYLETARDALNFSPEKL